VTPFKWIHLPGLSLEKNFPAGNRSPQNFNHFPLMHFVQCNLIENLFQSQGNLRISVAKEYEPRIAFLSRGFQWIPFEGIPFEEIPFEGILFEGISFEGIPFEGIPFEGIPFEGIPFERIPFEGVFR
jgi:hypothetical protein